MACGYGRAKKKVISFRIVVSSIHAPVRNFWHTSFCLTQVFRCLMLEQKNRALTSKNQGQPQQKGGLKGLAEWILVSKFLIDPRVPTLPLPTDKKRVDRQLLPSRSLSHLGATQLSMKLLGGPLAKIHLLEINPISNTLQMLCLLSLFLFSVGSKCTNLLSSNLVYSVKESGVFFARPD